MLIVRDTDRGVEIVDVRGQIVGTFRGDKYELAKAIIKIWNMVGTIRAFAVQTEFWHHVNKLEDPNKRITSAKIEDKARHLKDALIHVTQRVL